MIIKLLFNLVISIINFILALIPDLKFNFDMPDTTFFSNFLGLANYFFPVETLLLAISILIVFQNTKFILKIFNFIYKKIPFI